MLYISLLLLENDLKNTLNGQELGAEVLITTHDEVDLEVSEEGAQETASLLSRAMREAAWRFLRPELSGTDCVEVEVGPSWGGK